MTKLTPQELDFDEALFAITNNLVFKHEWQHGGELTAKAYRQNDDGSLTALDDAIKQLIRDCIEAVTPEKPPYPEIMEYVEMVKLAGENGKYDDMFDNGHKLTIDTIQANTKELLG